MISRRLHSVILFLFRSVIMGSLTQFLYKNLVLVMEISLSSVSSFLLTLLSLISDFLSTYVDKIFSSTGRYRLHGDDDSLKKNFDNSEIISSEVSNQKDFKTIESEPELELKPDADVKIDEVGFTDSEDDSEGKKLEFSFTFRFPSFEEFSKSKKEKNELFNSDSVSATNSSNQHFMPSKSYCDFIHEPEVLKCNVDQIDASENNLEYFSFEAAETFREQSNEKSVDDGPCDGEETEKNEATNSVISDSIDSHEEGFLSDEDFGVDEFKVVNFDSSMDVEYSRGETSDWNKDGESDYFGDEDSDIMDELSKLEGELLENNLDATTSEFLSEEDFHEDLNEAEVDKDDKRMNGSCDSEKLRSKDTRDLDQEDSNKLETLWEHQDLIEQLKMELRKVRATGLPTILEESECPKITDDLKPWKIDDKFQREDCMDELHKFYKRYRDKMRKFDIFNYQKMYAIGFLQLKDPLQPTSSSKTSGSTLESLLSQNFWQLKHKKNDNEPIMEFMKELQSDLEVVYVGQMCLSWEFLHWQYGKALDLWDSDPRGIHRYNDIAEEFQQFQVLLQRFVEDEHFQGPRVQNYIKCRCLNRNFLQVPVIREDNLKDRRKGRKGERAEYVITSDMMVETIEEAVRIFWRFIRADKDCSSAILSKRNKGTLGQLQNPGDLELLMEIKKILHKKERKLKDIVRGGNCILRRFRRCREDDDSDHVLYFFSQVDMKLVYRVLNMTRITTDQLVWCHSKLSRISFENRKIQVEPSFLLFPC